MGAVGRRHLEERSATFREVVRKRG
jgi:hypothetical protein